MVIIMQLIMNTKKSNNIIIIGSGGFGREVAHVASMMNKWKDIYFVDDNAIVNSKINDIQVIGKVQNLENYSGDVFIGIGNNQVRNSVLQSINNNKKLHFPNIIHPSCHWVNNKLNNIGIGNYVGEGSIGTINISIGNFNLINLACAISHDTKIGSFCNLMHGVKITSGAKLHDFINVGAGASILSTGHIESASEIKANSVYK